MARQHFDALDYNILTMLRDNARKPFLEIARESGVSGAAIHQRIQRLMSMGVIQGYECVVNPAKVGYQTCAYVGFLLNHPKDADNVLEQIKAIPEVVECHYTTGKYDLFIKVHARNNEHLLEVIREKLQSMGLGRTETLISFNEAFRRQIPIALDTVETV